MTEFDSLGRAFLIAALLVTPYAAIKIRQVRRIRRNHQAILDQETRGRDAFSSESAGPALEDVIADIGFVSQEARRNGGAVLVVPHDVTVSDRPAPAEIVDTLVRDALRRSGLAVTAEAESTEGRILECAPLSAMTTEPTR